MTATLLHQNDHYDPFPNPPMDEHGEWVSSQDPLTGEIVRIWKPYDVVPDDPRTPEDESFSVGEIRCMARGIVDGGIRVAGTTERFSDTYENIDFVKLWVPADTIISKRDRVTNIADATGHIRWLDEEYTDPRTAEAPHATVFNVAGVAPLFNAFNVMIEQFVLLDRASVRQDDSIGR